MARLYYAYSDYLKDHYGEKVYKLPINLPVTCPNRDGRLSYGGCSFCGAKGAGFEDLANTISVKEQLKSNKDYIGKRYKAKKFIAYLQNYTNTYLPLDDLKRYIEEIDDHDIVEVDISTRPDCINDDQLEYLKEYSQKSNKEIALELGLQTANYHTLKKINRGHGLAEFIDAVLRIKKYGFSICVHLILDLPWDTIEDIRETAKIITSLGIEQVKMHSLYITKGSKMALDYESGNLQLLTKDDYVERVICLLEHIAPEMVVQRLIGRAPETDTLTANWNMSWWKIKEEIEEKMRSEGIYQGIKCDYLNGVALR